MSASDIVLRVVPSVAIFALLVWLCCRVEPSGELEEQYFRERRAELESKLIIKRVVEASKKKSTLSQRLTESERAYSSYLSAFSSHSRQHASVRFAHAVEEQQQDETIEEGETQVEEESEHKNEEGTTAQVEESSAPKQPHGTASERRTKSSRSHLSWIPSFSSTPSDNACGSRTLQEPRRRRRKSNILARAISRSFRQSGTSCNICLMDYQVGEEVCWSPNEDCIHAFHKDCILDWLLRTRKCPVCRRDYVP